MLVEDLLSRVRGRLDDTTGISSTRGFLDEELIDDYANTARYRMFQVCKRLLIDSVTGTDANNLPLCRIPLVTGTSTYAISPRIIGIDRLKLASQTAPIQPITLDYMDSQGDWQAWDNAPPRAYVVDMMTDGIVFSPTPDKDDTAYLTVCRHPLSDLSSENPVDDLGFRQEYHHDLIPGILAQAFSKQDSEVYNPRKADEQRAIFETRIEEIRLETYRRSTLITNTLHMKAFMP